MRLDAGTHGGAAARGRLRKGFLVAGVPTSLVNRRAVEGGTTPAIRAARRLASAADERQREKDREQFHHGWKSTLAFSKMSTR